MFTRILMWIGIALGTAIVLVAAAAVGILYPSGNARLTRKYEVQAEAVPIPGDQASLELGKKWATVLCTGCHGADFGGKPMLDTPVIGYLAAPNLTPGTGGSGSEMTDADWIVAIRHGVDPHEGRSLIAMPSMNFYYLSDTDLGAIIAYLKSVPPVDRELGETKLSFLGKALVGAGVFGRDSLPAEVIPQTGPRPPVIAPAGSPEYGAYLVRIEGCRDCHGEGLTGGNSPVPGGPYAPDITSQGIFGTWSEKTFEAATRVKSGKGMPWDILKPLNSTELDAIYLYLRSLP